MDVDKKSFTNLESLVLIGFWFFFFIKIQWIQFF